MNENVFKFGIIGCGRIAERHAAQMAKYGKLQAVCDIVNQRANELAQLYNCNAYYTAEEFFNKEKEINIIAVCTPNGLHATHSIAAMEKWCTCSLRKTDGHYCSRLQSNDRSRR